MAPKEKKRVDVAGAAKLLGVTTSTVYGMVQRGELSVVGYDEGRMLLDAAEVERQPHRRRGHPRQPAASLAGATYAAEVAKGKSPADVARLHDVSRQDVSRAIARYNAARRREARAKAAG